MEVNKKFIGMLNKYLISVKYEDIIKYYKDNENLITDDTLYHCFINCLDNSFIKLAKWIFSLKKNIITNGELFLKYCNNGKVEVIKYLYEKLPKENINKTLKKGLSIAYNNNNLSKLQFLCSKLYYFNRELYLEDAINNKKNNEIILWLLDLGSISSIFNKNNFSKINYYYKKNPDIIKYIINDIYNSSYKIKGEFKIDKVLNNLLLNNSCVINQDKIVMWLFSYNDDDENINKKYLQAFQIGYNNNNLEMIDFFYNKLDENEKMNYIEDSLINNKTNDIISCLLEFNDIREINNIFNNNNIDKINKFYKYKPNIVRLIINKFFHLYDNNNNQIIIDPFVPLYDNNNNKFNIVEFNINNTIKFLLENNISGNTGVIINWLTSHYKKDNKDINKLLFTYYCTYQNIQKVKEFYSKDININETLIKLLNKEYYDKCKNEIINYLISLKTINNTSENKILLNNIFIYYCLCNKINAAKKMYSQGNINIRFKNDKVFRKCSENQSTENILIAKWLCSLCDDYILMDNNLLVKRDDYDDYDYQGNYRGNYYQSLPYHFYIKDKLLKIKEGLIKPILINEPIDCPICFEAKGRILKLDCNNYICMTCLDNLKNGNTTYKNKCCMCTKEIDYNGIELLEIENYVEEKQEKEQEIDIVNYDGGFIDDE